MQAFVRSSRALSLSSPLGQRARNDLSLDLGLRLPFGRFGLIGQSGDALL